ncbi:hypothetical protein, partial [Mesorhizobium sp. M7A.F.Ca.CA.001.09.2.1]|uniref:hypothetical protein n=1 Tax=Mesorhizobium sp. M7A.F.Ca.CA.001.09.2.1 TaxID=2496719 RepID=UPI0019D1BC7B
AEDQKKKVERAGEPARAHPEPDAQRSLTMGSSSSRKVSELVGIELLEGRASPGAFNVRSESSILA